jgi:UDP-2-acetamido-2,6-beta-L-arabino-hexul-4-ose reductase
MVIGNGLIARGFNEYSTNNGVVIFASGVSNSTNTDFAAFDREQKLLANTLANNKEKKIVYFSTCSIYDPSLQNSAYVHHKLAMENIIAKTHSDYLIFRISNLAGNTDNPHTVLNFFIQHILNDTSFYVWAKASRNIIDMSDALSICRHIINNDLFHNQAVNIANPVNYPVLEIVETIENYFGKKGNYVLIDKESNPIIDIKPIEKIIKSLAINFDRNYLERTIKKYFPLNDL